MAARGGEVVEGEEADCLDGRAGDRHGLGASAGLSLSAPNRTKCRCAGALATGRGEIFLLFQSSPVILCHPLYPDDGGAARRRE